MLNELGQDWLTCPKYNHSLNQNLKKSIEMKCVILCFPTNKSQVIEMSHIVHTNVPYDVTQYNPKVK